MEPILPYTRYQTRKPTKVPESFTWKALSDFVMKTCKDRDPTHGYEHMKIVAEISLSIYAKLGAKPELLIPIMIVAWLHGVADHKYDFDGKLKKQVDDFVMRLVGKDETKLVMLTIDCISFSKENKAIKEGKPIIFLELLGPKYAIIRDIVSDADKTQAIGKDGIIRCAEYASHEYFEKHKKVIPEKLLHDNIHKHAQEKLLRLKDEFFRTAPGKKMAESLHDDMIKFIEYI